VSISVVKCSEVLQCSDGLSNKVSNIIKRLTDNMKLLLICILLLSHFFLLSRFYFFIDVYMVVFLFDNVIYVFLLCLCILIVCLCIFLVLAGTLRFFPCIFFSCKANAMVKPAKTGHGPHSSKILRSSFHLIHDTSRQRHR